MTKRKTRRKLLNRLRFLHAQPLHRLGFLNLARLLPLCDLVILVGVDNMCILVHAVKRQQLELPLERRISNALVEVGPSITLASLSEVLAFAAGSFISMSACRVFSMFAALAVLLDFLLQVTAFVALIALDSLRAEDKRVDCFPCIKVDSLHADPHKGFDNNTSATLLSLFAVGCAMGSFIGGSIADHLSQTYPYSSRIMCAQFSVFMGIPF